MSKDLSTIQKITLAAMLIVTDFLGTRIPGLFQMGSVFSFNRLTVGPAIVIFSSLTLGPFFGALVGAGGDALGWILLGTQTGPLNIFITIMYGLLGVFPWLLEKLFGRIKESKGSVYVLFGFLTLLYALLLVFLFPLHTFDDIFLSRWGMNEEGVLILKIVLSIVCLLLLAGLFIGLYFTDRYFQKRKAVMAGLPSPVAIGFISVICEIFLVFFKPFAFYLYCLLFIGEPLETAWGISYGVLVLLSILFCFADIFINTFLVSWLLMFSKPFLNRNSLLKEKAKP